MQVEENKLLRPTSKTYNLLYAKSGNRCAFPKCPTPITMGSTLVGEVAHIKGEAPGAARYDINQDAEGRRAPANLILLCRIHHKVVDDDWKSYPVERLREMKAEHEASATQMSPQEAQSGVAVLVSGDVSVIANNPTNSIVAGFYQHNVHQYGSPGSIAPIDDDFKAKMPLDGEGRFRAMGEKLGVSQPFDPFGLEQKPKDYITLESGPIIWLRVIPKKPISNELTFADLETAYVGNGAYPLRTLHAFEILRLQGADGIGTYYKSVSESRSASAVTFQFKSGEIWSIERKYFFSKNSMFALSAMLEDLPPRMEAFSSVLSRLGFEPPFRWLAGLEDCEGVRITYEAPAGQHIFVYPELRSNYVREGGVFSPGDDTRDVIKPFVVKIFGECAKQIPPHLG